MPPTLPEDGYLGPTTPSNGSGRYFVSDRPINGCRDEEPRYTVFAMVALVACELGFVLAMTLWVELTTAQALHAAGGATAIGIVAFYGKAMLLAVGRRMLGHGGG